MQSELRLKKRKDFRRIYNRGKSVANRELVLFVSENKQIEKYRVGISVSKKIGKAIVRNRVKRYIKEVFRKVTLESGIPIHLEMIIIARKPTANMNFDDFERSVKDLLRKSKLLQGK